MYLYYLEPRGWQAGNHRRTICSRRPIVRAQNGNAMISKGGFRYVSGCVRRFREKAHEWILKNAPLRGAALKISLFIQVPISYVNLEAGARSRCPFPHEDHESPRTLERIDPVLPLALSPSKTQRSRFARWGHRSAPW